MVPTSPLGVELDFYAKFFCLFVCFFFVLFWLNNLLSNHASESAKKKSNTCHANYNIQFDLNDLRLVVELSTNTI